MKRLIFVAAAFLAGCSGMSSSNGGGAFVPSSPNAATSWAGGPASQSDARRKQTKVRLTLTVPRRHRGERAGTRHPSTISSATQSVSIQVNGGAVSVFNATPSSPGCSIGPSGTVCTFSLDAPIGADTFVITTYNAPGAGGTMLDRGSAVFNVVTGKANTPSIKLGPVVSITADSGVGSLRYAIGSANPGDTIMLLLPSGSTISLASPLTISNRISIAGPGVTASARRRGGRHDSATYTGITISGGGLQQLFVIQAGATVSISGLILANGNATTTDQPGGAIYNNGTLALASDVLTANVSAVDSPYVRRAPHRHAARAGHRAPPAQPAHSQGLHPHCSGNNFYGGAVYNHASLTVTGSIFDGNKVSSDPGCGYYGYGGAIYNDEYGTLSSSSNLYTNNAAYYGGAVYNNAVYGQAAFANDAFTANLGCTTATGCSTDPTGYGAAIYDSAGQGISVSASTFTSNVAGGNVAGSYGEGGALVLVTGTPSVTGSVFTSNQAGGGTTGCSEGDGGAIYFDASGPLELDNDTFTGNQAGGDKYGNGGAIESYEPINGSNDTFASNIASGTGSSCYADAYAYGGALYADDGAALSSTSFSNNSASSAYYSEGGAILSESPSRLTGDTFTSNSASTTGPTPVADTYANGGAIYSSDYLTVSGSTFTSNSATSGGTDSLDAYGGAVYSSNQMSSSGNTFMSNSVTIGGAVASEAYGGAIYSNGSSAILTSLNDHFSSNSGTATGAAHSDVYGGAIYSNEALSVSGDAFVSNTVTGPWDAYGGAISTGGLNSTISNSSFATNIAQTNGATPQEISGGAIDDEGTTTIGGVTITGNSAAEYGGGIFENGAGSNAISNATISGNTVTASNAGDEGGGAIFGCDSFVLANSAISGNSVTLTGAAVGSGGGGIYNYDGLTMTGTTVSGNSVHGSIATSGGGGILNNDDGTFVNSTITGNTSSIDGGGYEAYGSGYTIYLSNDTIYQNSATGLGGNLDNVTSFTTVLANSIVAGGSAGTGADINNSATLTSDDYNIIQTAVHGTAIGGTTTHNQAVDPQLLALANNGGPTLTNADQAASPGQADIPFSINNGSGTATCGTYNSMVGLINVDQRGFTRGSGGRCDVGAYELAGAASSIREHIPVVHGHHKRHRHHPRLPQAPNASAQR